MQTFIMQSAKYMLKVSGAQQMLWSVGEGIADVSTTEGEAYDAERHLVIGTPASPPILASVHYSWYKSDQPHLGSHLRFPLRSPLPGSLGNLSSANLALSTFTLASHDVNPALLAMSQPLESSKSGLSLRIFPSIPLLNFLSLLLLAAQKGDSSPLQNNWSILLPPASQGGRRTLERSARQHWRDLVRHQDTPTVWKSVI